jgi:DNA-binding transcriptional ArsR family regulator
VQVIIDTKFDTRNLASVDGQILLALADGPCNAGEIYAWVNASQPTVSRRLGSLLEAGIIDVRQTPDDRRFSVYSLNYSAIRNCISREQIMSFVKLATIIGQVLSPEEIKSGADLPTKAPPIDRGKEHSPPANPLSSEALARPGEREVAAHYSAA